ncbi:alpha/beta hydrolase [Leptospira levettii]|uniref:Alpha/beta hydrolase n=1 Tax=Leptospira levettii TaxID=2023178 RepID=A0A6H3NAQ5_9LEPT|nr:alpha/beta hydrolase [Leptospira levettii]MCW7467120.1 alpha/beta hydrolase [Leptospira levettii]MCW7497763.1 alpha/beta hydrolase [Leptospira levettii]MCW7512842.1 alpha/beta hydrolase [Leptospira levettii]MCW7516564.1 alpha/beta hydrolase [Leptospira levettii]TGM75126.1 alpha/beta hydrolase [Leptospira levettii]
MKVHYHYFPILLPILFPLCLWADDFPKNEKPITSYFALEEGKIAYTKSGSGKQNFILLPGIGDRKESYSDLVHLLKNDGNVYTFDLRGLGESDVSFTSYGPKETALDILSFIQKNNLQNVYIIANSMTAASAVYIQSKEKKRVLGMVLSGPFVRDKEPMSWVLKSMLQIAFRGPWGPSAWAKFYESLFPIQPPKDIEERKEKLKENLKEEGRMVALRSMLFAPKEECENELAHAKGNHIIIMGLKDPDFTNPEEETNWIRDTIGGKVYVYENGGHYTFVEEPNRFYSDIKSLWQKK